jgi:hypothetical protein
MGILWYGPSVGWAWALHGVGIGLASPVHEMGLGCLWAVHDLYCAWAGFDIVWTLLGSAAHVLVCHEQGWICVR